MQTFSSRLEQISEWTGRAIAWLTLIMVVVTFLIVILRYAFNMGWIGMQESVTYLHALVFMLGAAYTLKHDDHVRVDIFYRDMNSRQRALVDLLGAALLLMPVNLFILWVCWDYVLTSWSLQEGSADPGGLPWVYLLKTVILIMPVLTLLQGLAQALKSWTTYRTQQVQHG